MSSLKGQEHDFARVDSSQATQVNPETHIQTSTKASDNVSPTDKNATRNSMHDGPGGNTGHKQADQSTTPFVEAVQNIRKDMDHEFENFRAKLESQENSDSDVVGLDWEMLENEYQQEVGTLAMNEVDIIKRFNERFRQFMLWMEVSHEREGQRALKRIKTQAAFVQHSEEELQKQEQHYDQVMNAFQHAMQLLRTPS